MCRLGSQRHARAMRDSSVRGPPTIRVRDPASRRGNSAFAVTRAVARFVRSSLRMRSSSSPLLLVLLFAASAAAACGDASTPDGAPAPETDVPVADAAPAPLPDPLPDASPADVAPGDAGPSDAAPPKTGLRIAFDYRFDTFGFFSDPVRKQSLEAAAAIWSKLLKDQFAKVPKGTYAITRNPEKYLDPAAPVTLDADIEGILVFVGSSKFTEAAHARASSTAGVSQVADPALAQALRARYDGADHEPWTGWIAFNRDRDFHFDASPKANGTVPAGKIDFVSVALHEIGHVLGIGVSKAWDAYVDGTNWTGPKAKAVFGGPVPLSADKGHVPTNMLFDGGAILMDNGSAAGERTFPSPLDLAMLADIGYEL